MPLRRLRGLLLLLCLVGLLATSTLPAVAATDPPSPDQPTDQPSDHPTDQPDPEAYRDLANEVTRNTARLTDLSTQIDVANAKITALEGTIATTQQQLDATRAEIARLKGIVRARAAFIYTHARTPRMLLDIPHVEDLSVGTQYAQSATIADAGRISDLTRTADATAARLQSLQAAHDEQVHQRDDLQATRDALQVANDKKKKLLDDAGAITIMGDSQLTGDQIASWFESRNVKYKLTGDTTIDDLADLFVEEGNAEHVRGDIAFAQSVLETGSFGNAWDNNYGGIGACDSCHGEIAFPTPRDGVRGQIQMLRNYADPTSRAANLANPPSPQIYGHDPVAAAAAYDSFFAKGRVPTWNLMGNGNWATATEYAPHVLGLYFEMVAFANRKA
ncbi:MAG TPA: hypothetical protein VH986_02935 [Acidimicrobiia bacterium]|jgi:TolA-binding protein